MTKADISIVEDGDDVVLQCKTADGSVSVRLDRSSARQAGLALLKTATTPDSEQPASFLHEEPLLILKHAGVQVGSLGEEIVLGFRVPRIPPVIVHLMDEQVKHLLDHAQSLLDIPPSLRTRKARH